ncbi:MAG: hypothetical protein CMJ40_09555 [Phycisphaerae bacterium]|nr:hypothetical protein [Phycisphaerae bacterium]|tara:strand:+ start:657 stop:1100 length:444 start_codon:yes stop_codon:yes gene_type:complete
MASLLIISGPNDGEFYSIKGDTLIGRGDDCTIQIADERASRHHSKVVIDSSVMVPGTNVAKKRFILSDMGSSNGTYSNGSPIDGEQVLKDGQTIGIGGTTILFTTRDYTTAEEALEEITNIGQGTLADAPSHWPMSDSWREERTVTD